MAGGRRRGADPAKLAEFVADSGLSFHKGPRSWDFTCPRCHERGKLGMLRDTGRFKCWRCGPTEGFQGAPEFALAELTGRSVLDVRRAIYDDGVDPSGYLDLDLEEEEAETYQEVEEPLAEVTWPYHCYELGHRHAANGVAYLEGRGVARELAERYGVRYSPKHRAVAFPVRHGGALVGWQFRTIDPVKVELPGGGFSTRLRLWSSRGTWRSRALMFAERVTGDYAVLCEGPVDALKCDLVGGNVCSMGTAVGEGQVRTLLMAGVRKLYLAFDPDAAGSFSELIGRFPGVEGKLVRVPKGFKDLGAMTLDQVKQAVGAAVPLHPGQLHFHLDPLPGVG